MTGISPNHRDKIIRLAKRTRPTATRLEPDEGRKTSARLSRIQVAQMIAAYEASARTTHLAVQFGVHRNTVQRVLKANAVALRQVSSLPDH